MRTLPARIRQALTYDQGKEVAHHPELEKRLNIRLILCLRCAFGRKSGKTAALLFLVETEQPGAVAGT